VLATRTNPLGLCAALALATVLSPGAVTAAELVPPNAGPSRQHPRLWITPEDLPRLRSWATPNNPLYAQGIVPALAVADKIYSVGNPYNGKPLDGPFYLNGRPNPNWPDTGGSGVGAPYAEPYAEFYAFMAMLDPVHRAVYAQKARNLLMHVIDAVAKCPKKPSQNGSEPPYCDPQLPTFNRSNYVGEAFGLTVDWLQAADPTGAIFTAADRATTRKVFLKWAQAIVDNSFIAPDLNYGLLDAYKGNNQRQLRNAANNYYSGNTRFLTLMALSLDAVDDPPLDGNPANVMKLGNTLRSYIRGYVIPVRLYQQYAMYEEATKVAAEYGIAKFDKTKAALTDRVGLASGGLPVEGFLYGHSMVYVLQELMALHSAGYDELVHDGKTVPQAALLRSTYWDRFLDGFLSSLMPAPIQPKGPYAYMPPVYQMASYGDLLYEYVTDFDFLPMFSALAINYRQANKPAWRDKALWVAANVMPGGAANLPALIADSFTNAGASSAILTFMAFDPAIPVEKYPDPRAALPTTFVTAPIARIISRTDRTPNASIFAHICSWASINHQYSNCGQFDFFRKGEWLTKERSGYDNGVNGKPAYGYAPDYHNVLGIQNDMSKLKYAELAPDLQALYERGGQWNNDLGISDPQISSSTADAYVYAQDVATGMYNMSVIKAYPETNSAQDVQHASRSILWVKPDHIVVYDRARTKSAGLFKRFNLVLVQKTDDKSRPVPPTISGALVTATTPRGQNLFVRALLPANPTTKVTVRLVERLNPVALLEPTEAGPEINHDSSPSGYRLQVEDTRHPKDARFLTVLQGADAGQTADAATEVATTGLAFDGAFVRRKAGGNLLVLFRRDIESPLSSKWTATCELPDALAAGNGYVADLTPGATYYLSRVPHQLTISSESTSGASAIRADAGGLLRM
jgi:hypothetical protein